METQEIRKKLHDYVDSAEEEKIKAIYTVLESDINAIYDHWNDPEFVAEMDSRVRELESGEVKGSTWQEVKQRALQSIAK